MFSKYGISSYCELGDMAPKAGKVKISVLRSPPCNSGARQRASNLRMAASCCGSREFRLSVWRAVETGLALAGGLGGHEAEKAGWRHRGTSVALWLSSVAGPR